MKNRQKKQLVLFPDSLNEKQTADHKFRTAVTAEQKEVKKRTADIGIYVFAFMETDRDRLAGILALKNPL